MAGMSIQTDSPDLAPPKTGRVTQIVGEHVFVAYLPVHDSHRGPVYHSNDLIRFELAVAVSLADLRIICPQSMHFMRKAMGLTRSALGQMLGLLESPVAWERDERPPHGITPLPELALATFHLLGAMAEERLRGQSRILQAMQGSVPAPMSVPVGVPIVVQPGAGQIAIPAELQNGVRS
jgi:hypothetical protein